MHSKTIKKSYQNHKFHHNQIISKSYQNHIKIIKKIENTKKTYLLWFRYDFVMISLWLNLWFWYDFDMILIWLFFIGWGCSKCLTVSSTCTACSLLMYPYLRSYSHNPDAPNLCICPRSLATAPFNTVLGRKHDHD